MRDWKIVKQTEREDIDLVFDLAVSTEVIAQDTVSVYGTMGLTPSGQFYVKYSLNDVEMEVTKLTYSLVVAVKFQNSNFDVGDNFIKVDVYSGKDEHLYTATKLIVKNYYGYICTVNKQFRNVRDLDYICAENTEIYLGLQQDNINFILSELSIEITALNTITKQVWNEELQEYETVEDTQQLVISPIIEEFDITSNKPPKAVDGVSITTNIKEGKNTINLLPLLLVGQVIYGIKISTSNARLLFTFFHSQQSYHTVYLQRPKIVYNDRATITWDNVTIRSPEIFEKFVLLRDSQVIFETTKITDRKYTDSTLTTGQTYLYQLQVWINVNDEVLWDFTQAVADLWKPKEREKLSFYEQNVGMKKLPIDVYGKMDNIESNPAVLVQGNGVFVANANGANIFNEYFAGSTLDFSDRVGITKLLVNNSMDGGLVSIVDNATFVRNLDIGKLWKVRMRKRARSIAMIK